MIVKGSDLMIFSKLSDAIAAIAYATSHTLDIQATATETSSKDSGKWAENQITKYNWTGTSENLCSGVAATDAYGLLFKKMTSGEPVDIHSTVAEDADSNGVPAGGWVPKAGQGLKGKALITGLTLNAPNDGNATMTVSLTGTGKLFLDEAGA